MANEDLADRFRKIITHPRLAKALEAWKKKAYEGQEELFLDILEEDCFVTDPFEYTLVLTGINDFIRVSGPFKKTLTIGINDDNEHYAVDGKGYFVSQGINGGAL